MVSKARFILWFAVCRAGVRVSVGAFSLLSNEPAKREVTVDLPISSSGRTEEAGEQDISQKRAIKFQLHSSIDKIPPDEWNACLTNFSSPFLRHSWLQCLEDSGCASSTTGWVPQHLSIEIDGEKGSGFVPVYLKRHSLGEFVFDQQFAEAAYQSGIPYYPKLLVGVPFTPVTGERILWHGRVRENFSRDEMGSLNRAVATFLQQAAMGAHLSSVHINFLTDQEASDLAGTLESDPRKRETGSIGSLQKKVLALFRKFELSDDYRRRTSLQYHWKNCNPHNNGRPYESFDDYLRCFKSKKRISIKRERRKVLDEENVQIDVIKGKDILKHDNLVKRMFQIYLSTIEKLVWGRQYLTFEFFDMLCKSDFIENLVFLCCRRNAGTGKEFTAQDVFAGTINVVKDGVFYGRYWGCLQDVKNLHFECCYWSAIDYCIRQGLKRMEPGAGGGDYKWTRGFDPALVHSVHYFCHPGLRRAVSQFIADETESNVELSNNLLQKSAVSFRHKRKTVPLLKRGQ